MITRTFKLCLNAGTGSAPYINVSQYDEGETWLFELYSETGERYIPTTGAIVGVKSDGHGIANTGTVDSEGRVVIAETQQMTASAGRAIYELSIDGLTHGTANFIVAVERKPTDDAVMSDSDLSLIQEAIDSAEVIVEVIGDGDPSEVIGEHVDAWLDNHPEATTTVLDGAITAPKINQSLWDKLLVSEEASGAVASFDDGADDVPVSSLKVALEPIQLGSGDPSPSNVRPIIASNGVNVWDEVWELGTIDGNGNNYNANDRIRSKNYISVPTGDVYIKAPVGLYVWSYDANKTYLGRLPSNGNPTSNGILTIPNTVSYIRFAVMPAYGTAYNHDISINYPSTYTAYQPYQGIMVEQTGKNLIWTSNNGTDYGVTCTRNSDGTYVATGTATGTAVNVWLAGGYGTGYKLCKVPAGTVIATDCVIFFHYEGGTLQGFGSDNTLGGRRSTIYTFTEPAWIDGVRCPSAVNGTTYNTTIYPQLEYGTEATAYEPFTGNTYPYSLGQSVYGGTVDLATGVLTVTHKYVVFNGGWSIASNGVLYVDGSATDGKTGYVVCNQYPYGTIVGGTAAAMQYPKQVCIQALNGLRFLLYDNTYTTAEAFNTYLASNPLQVVYLLATPTTINLTPTEVKTLLGYNNISSTGTVDVIYHADTKLYVDKMTAVDNNIIAPTEETFTATRNYTVNDLVIVNDTLYKVTANIATGSAITPNSNVQQTTLGALIKALS